MIKPNIIRFPSRAAGMAIFLYISLQLALILLFPSHFIGYQWILFGFSAVIFFFYLAVNLPVKWAKASEKIFLRKIFRFALIIRVLYVFFSYYYYIYMTGQPFEFDAADATGYHGEAIWMVDLFESGNLQHYFTNYLKGYSDAGWPLFLFPIYLIFRETILIPRLLNAVFGAWMVILVYHLAKRNFDEGVGRLSAILVAILPNLIYYTGMHLKETLMLFLLIAFLNQTDQLIRSKANLLIPIIKVGFWGVTLFFFRTVLGISVFLALGAAITFSSKLIVGGKNRFALIILAAFFGFIMIVYMFSAEIGFYYENRQTNQDAQMEKFANREGGNKLALYGKSSLFVPIILIAPFPTMVNTEQPNSQMINGSVFVKNASAFFIFYALIFLWKKKQIRKHLLLLLFMATYLGVLASSGFALSERFHMPVLPVLMIFIAYGIKNLKPDYQKYYIPYLLLIVVLIIGWNWFKLAGRGII